MNTFKIFKALLLFSLFANEFLLAQSTFSIEEYQDYLAETSNMTYEQLAEQYAAGYFKNKAESALDNVQYLDSIDMVYKLTDYENDLLEKHSFMVTERISPQSFITGFRQVWDNDLPVYISTDAILHALHLSYDTILKDFERGLLIPKIKTLLNLMHQQVAVLEETYAADSAMQTMLKDIDVYLTVPRRLFDETATPHFADNVSVVNDLLASIETQLPIDYPLFASKSRKIDFSQFKPRGHYTQDEELTRYFKAMMWLGRIEIYLTAPKSDDPVQPTKADIQRQLIDAVLISEAIENAQAESIYNEIEQVILYFIGESDNVTLGQLSETKDSFALQNAAQLQDSVIFESFQNHLIERVGSSQKILSHILESDPMKPEKIEPATAFLLFGQRFVIDSYVMGNVVYDRILFNGQKVRRMLPSSLDVLFALGNDAALQLLSDEMQQYPYASNLVSNRYLIDAYDAEFWQSSLYNSWLQSIRTLAPAAERENLPLFMQSAAWWHKSMNSQLASWAQLRHDNLLYVKQSYTSAIGCDYPESFVEPVPEFYSSVADFAETASKITEFMNEDDINKSILNSYFTSVSATMDTLEIIAQKELQGIIPNTAEKNFLKKMLFVNEDCGIQYSGWYPKLYWPHWADGDSIDKKDMVIADVHTAPTDAGGSPVGWVLHAGTGPLDMAIVVSDLANGKKTAFAGPVMSYYEHVSTNFQRLTDEEWQTAYRQERSTRPDYVNLYLADQTGNSRGTGRTLLTALNDQTQKPFNPKELMLAQNYPNPFNGTTIITFNIPYTLSGKTVDLTIFDIQGRVIKNLLNRELPTGNYSTRWDGLTNSNASAASGLYFYKLKVAGYSKTGKMLLTK